MYPHISAFQIYAVANALLHFALHQMLTLTVDIWAWQEQEGSEEREETKMTCQCIRFLSLGLGLLNLWQQNWSDGCL